MHCHGGNGFDVMEGSQSIERMSKYHLSHGTTSIMPTTWTNTFEETQNALEGFNDIYNKITKEIIFHCCVTDNSYSAGDEKTFELLSLSRRVALTDVTVFINGPTGSG